MRTEHLEFLTKLNNGESLNSLADKLHITPQGLSLAIISMEKELGCTLINRTKKGIFLTQDAVELIDYANDFLGKLNRIKYKKQTNLCGELKLFTTLGSIKYLLSDKIAKFTKENPHVRIDLQPCSRNSLPINDIDNNKIIFTAVPYLQGKEVSYGLMEHLHANELEFKNILTRPMCIECHKSLWHKSTIKLSELKNCKIFLLENNYTNEFFSTFEHAAAIEFLYAASSEIYYSYLLNKVGFGCDVYTDGKIDYHAAEALKQVLIEDDIKINLGYIEKKNAIHSEITQRFIDFISY